ncbi:OLC1v1003161C1 [Oldenlandia corymbosa var. corymbosa]|uniref:OLC1v1003161C1 n=1 Tax=Oldenlandia corymbosa var. corymbosa TaxID=529605 RepID=A0AAV1D9K7_OLDCO|nr:OLC1v1003161C1 [Oldenlandia corymbosa var. corymbosa]
MPPSDEEAPSTEVLTVPKQDLLDLTNKALTVAEQDLIDLTNNFSPENLICKAQFCRLYRGKVPPQGWKGIEGERNVTVKVWEETGVNSGTAAAHKFYEDLVHNFEFEKGFLTSTKATSSDYLPRLIAHAREDTSNFLGVVYDLHSVNTLRHFIREEEFEWQERVKVATRLAQLLRFLIHDEPRYLIQDLSAAHIMLDKDWNPILFNYFNLALAEDLKGPQYSTDRLEYGSNGYIDPVWLGSCWRGEYGDVFAFGVILCELLYKRRVDDNVLPDGSCFFLTFEVWRDFPLEKPKFKSLFKKQREFSFVHQTFREDPHFNKLDGSKISKLARLCVDLELKNRPDMKQVVKCLKQLHVVRGDH